MPLSSWLGSRRVLFLPFSDRVNKRKTRHTPNRGRTLLLHALEDRLTPSGFTEFVDPHPRLATVSGPPSCR